jgi:hypothetical protein
VIYRVTKLRAVLLAGFALCALFGVAVLWVEHEAKSPSYTSFPLRNGAQQALLSCAAGYARLDITATYPLAPIQEEASEAASVDSEFEPLATLASGGLTTPRSQKDFTLFCQSHRLWP